ncbi:MAG: lysophospholipid acyltransferase family protein [Bacteroidota bacterium]
MNRIGFGILLLISFLPLWFLFRISDLFYLILISVFPYRNKVIENNLRNSFPELSNEEIRKFRNKFYRHFADLVIEGIKNLTISKNVLAKRFVLKNPTIVNELIAKNQSVMLISGHYGNWEWMITSLATWFDCKTVGIGMPLTNSFWDEALNKRRSRFGLQVAHSGNYKVVINSQEANVILVLSDQSPSNSENAYWTEFLNQQTAVLFGAEFMMNDQKFIPVFFKTTKVKRGFYEVELVPFEGELNETNYGEITSWHTQLLEKTIKQQPEFWLWSHKRWKREIPVNLDELRKSQEARFNKRFRTK